MKLTDDERDFLIRLRDNRPLKIADDKEDKLRQRMRRKGLTELIFNPRRWQITPAGRAALENADG